MGSSVVWDLAFLGLGSCSVCGIWWRDGFSHSCRSSFWDCGDLGGLGSWRLWSSDHGLDKNSSGFWFPVWAFEALGSLGRYVFGMGVDVGVGIWPFAGLCAWGGVFASGMPALGGSFRFYAFCLEGVHWFFLT